MTTEEHRRWLDFSTRLARHGWPNATEARKERISEVVQSFIEQYEDCAEKVGGWDGSEAGIYVCDDADEFLSSHCHRPANPETQTRFERQFLACVRAGLDVASEPSAGVVGFDVGTLRGMYDGDIPPWIAQWFTPALTGAEPDTAELWL